MIKRVDHIGIVVRDIDETAALYEKAFGLKPERVETILAEQWKGKIAVFELSEGAEIELIQPIDVPELAQFLEERGQGLHHIALVLDDIDETLKSLAAKGVKLRDKEARRGLAGMIAFVDAEATGGVLIELVQKV